MLERPTLRPGEHLLVHRLRKLGLAKNHPTAWAAQRLMRGGRDYLRMGDGGRVHAAGDEPGEMRHVDDEYCADFIGDRAQRREIDDPRVRATATDDDPRSLLLRDFTNQIVVDAPRVLAHGVRRRLE